MTTPVPDRRPEAVLRSLKRYVAVALGDAYEVRLGREEGAFQRPFARVAAAGTPTLIADTQFLGTLTQPYTIACYPLKGHAPDDGDLGAQATAELLVEAFMVGVENGRPMRMPLYNYRGITRLQAGVWLPPDYVRVSDFSTQTVADPDDNTLWTVLGSLRLNWRRTLAPSSTGDALSGVGIAPASP